jgi:hypothetical protein
MGFTTIGKGRQAFSAGSSAVGIPAALSLISSVLPAVSYLLSITSSIEYRECMDTRLDPIPGIVTTWHFNLACSNRYLMDKLNV